MQQLSALGALPTMEGNITIQQVVCISPSEIEVVHERMERLKNKTKTRHRITKYDSIASSMYPCQEKSMDSARHGTDLDDIHEPGSLNRRLKCVRMARLLAKQWRRLLRKTNTSYYLIFVRPCRYPTIANVRHVLFLLQRYLSLHCCRISKCPWLHRLHAHPNPETREP